MLTISNLKYIFFIFLLSACQSNVTNLSINNEHLSLVNGKMLYDEKPYSGSLFSKTDTLTIYKAMYVNGNKHGEEQKFFYNGDLAQSRSYTKGKNSGTHRSWWKKDLLMFEYHFDKNGDTIGIQREWHSNGLLSKELNYTDGKEDGTQKIWDFNGQIITNNIVINDERFGLIGSKKCKTITNVE